VLSCSKVGVAEAVPETYKSALWAPLNLKLVYETKNQFLIQYNFAMSKVSISEVRLVIIFNPVGGIGSLEGELRKNKRDK